MRDTNDVSIQSNDINRSNVNAIVNVLEPVQIHQAPSELANTRQLRKFEQRMTVLNPNAISTA